MSDMSNKQRILNLMEIFKNDTDEHNHLSLDDIFEKMLKKAGPEFDVNMKSIRSDIKSLSDFGFNIDHEVGQHNKKLYYYQDREFELYELRMLIDAVSSARFITSGESERLISKLKAQTSKYLAKDLENQICLDNKIKCENNSVRFFIDSIHRAISNNFKIKFQYGKYDLDKNFKLNKEGQYYTLQPYALTWNYDFYYVIGIFEGKNNFSHYRIDRMRNVQVIEEAFHGQDFDVTTYTNKTFYMYSGKVEIIELQFKNTLINVIIDSLGKDVKIVSTGKDSFNIEIEAAISDGLISWLLTWGSSVKVISPISLKEKVQEEILIMFNLYKE